MTIQILFYLIYQGYLTNTFLGKNAISGTSTCQALGLSF